MGPKNTSTTENAAKPTGMIGGTPGATASAGNGRQTRTARAKNAATKVQSIREAKMSEIETVEDAVAKLVEHQFMTKETEITSEGLSLMMMQLTLQMAASTVNKSVVLLKALALLVAKNGICDLTNEVAKGVIEMVTGEAVTLATADAITNQLWQPMKELKALKNDLVEWQNTGGLNANMGSFQESLTAEMKAVAMKIAEDAKAEVKKVTEEAAAEVKKAAESLTKAIGELATIRAAHGALENTGGDMHVDEGPSGATPPALWWNEMKAREDAIKAEEAAALMPQAQGVAPTFAEMLKAKRTLTQKQALEKLAGEACKILVVVKKEGTTSGLEGLSPEVLIKKAELAIELMRKGG